MYNLGWSGTHYEPQTRFGFTILLPYLLPQVLEFQVFVTLPGFHWMVIYLFFFSFKSLLCKVEKAIFIFS